MKWVSRQGSRSLKVTGYSAKEATLDPLLDHAACTCCAVRLCLSLIAFLVLHMCILVVSRYNGLMVCLLCYYGEYRWRTEVHEGVHEGVVAVIQWILTEHYQEGSVSEELLKEMLFWSCRYIL